MQPHVLCDVLNRMDLKVDHNFEIAVFAIKNDDTSIEVLEELVQIV